MNLIKLAEKLYPLGRSISSPHNIETIRIINEFCDDLFELKEFSPGKYFDWEAPDRWYLDECRLIDPKGNDVFSYEETNLHCVAHSTGFVGELELTELLGKIHSDPARPTVTPYKTTYYSKE